jgi:anti-anti-sigma factor
MGLEIIIDRPQPLTLSLSLDGQLDTVTAPDLEKAIQEHLKIETEILIFNLAKLDFVSSAGLRIFAKARKNMKGKQGQVFFTHLTPQVKKVFDIVKAVPLSEVFSDTDELDAYLTKIQANIKNQP